MADLIASFLTSAAESVQRARELKTESTYDRVIVAQNAQSALEDLRYVVQTLRAEVKADKKREALAKRAAKSARAAASPITSQWSSPRG